MFKSAKQKAASFKWTSQQDIAVPMEGQITSLMSPVGLEGAIQSEELAESSHSSDASSVLEDYDKFKTEQELKLLEWLEASGGDTSK